jgi:phospholipid/cholesterol/gamma-HCH transport system substrate-binding protein
VKQRVLIGAFVVAVVVTAVVAMGAGGSSGGDYKVRAVFNNASFLIPGEDVKVAGAKVGKVDSLDVTSDVRAAAVLSITDSAFQDFRADAQCAIRLQSVIGEKLVECLPTQPRAEGTAAPPPLKKIPDGQPGAGQYLLPVENTITPVTEDLIRDVMRLPYRTRFAIILNEFGAGLAGRGKDIRTIIRGANPALREFDSVIKILAKQNKQLAQGAKSGDKVLAEWAARRKAVADTIVQANIAAQATAERRVDLEKNFALFPKFLQQLRPTMASLDSLSQQMLPVFNNLNQVGPEVSRLLIALGPFSRAGIPAFQSLGRTVKTGGPALQAAKPTVDVLASFTARARSVAKNLAALLTSFDNTNGVKYLTNAIYNLAMSVNGFDDYGHYLRTTLLAGCNSQATILNQACSANFVGGSSAGASAAGANRARSAVTRLLAGEDPNKVLADYRRKHPGTKLPQLAAAPTSNQQAQSAPRSAVKTKKKKKSKSSGGAPSDGMLNYLLGSGQ